MVNFSPALTLTLPTIIVQAFPGFVLYRYLPFVVKYIQPLGYMSQTAAVWCTVLLAVNRYVALCLPFQACRWATVRIVRFQLLAVVIGLLVLNVPRFFQYEVLPDNNHLYISFSPRFLCNKRETVLYNYYCYYMHQVADGTMTALHLSCLFLS